MAETDRLRVNLFPETKGDIYVCPTEVADLVSPGTPVQQTVLSPAVVGGLVFQHVYHNLSRVSGVLMTRGTPW